MDDPLALAEAYLESVRFDEPTHEVCSSLATLDRGTLRRALSTDEARLAFWINLYNATAQSMLAADPAVFDAKGSFFGSRLATVAGESLSLDRIEHGMLRRSFPKWTFGYVPNPFPSAFERAFQVEERDPRIHFALNCGAASCPPILAYERARIESQLDLATESYLRQEVTYDAEANRVTVPRLMLWFRGDFGGRAGTLAFLRQYDVIPDDASPSLSYDSYDWSLAIGRFESDSDGAV